MLGATNESCTRTMTSTTTTTVLKSSALPVLPLKAPLNTENPQMSRHISTSDTLEALYNRAARAFLHRNTTLTHSLVASAFGMLQPPSFNPSDRQCAVRRKWDILRITLETTLYTTPQSDQASLPSEIQARLAMPAEAVAQASVTRSLHLFTPTLAPGPKPDAAYLPAPVLVTLVLSCLKMRCPDVGRVAVENWLARRGQAEGILADDEGYEKVIETYCLRILPRLDQWDYSLEFLEYENEMPKESRTRIISELQLLQESSLAPSSSRPITPSDYIEYTPRPISPAPSMTSSTSSISTTSTKTAVPTSHRHPTPGQPNGHTPISTSPSTESLASDRTIRETRASQKTRLESHVNSNAARHQSHSRASRISSTSFAGSRPNGSIGAATTSLPSTMAVIKAALAPYLSRRKVATFVLLFFVFPVLSYLFRRRRRKLRDSVSAAGVVSGTAAAVARQRLGEASLLRRVWAESIRAVMDTVRMGGSGLV